MITFILGDGRYTMLIAVGLADPEDITIDPKSGYLTHNYSYRLQYKNY